MATIGQMVTTKNAQSESVAPLAVRPEEAAQLIRVSRAHMYRLLQSGEIRSARAGRVRLVPVAALREWLDRVAS